MEFSVRDYWHCSDIGRVGFRKSHWCNDNLDLFLGMKSKLIALLLFGVPQLASAASIAGSRCSSVLSSFPCLAQGLGNLLGLGTAILIGIAIIFYFWGIVQKVWFAEAGSAKSLESLRTQLIWGLVALFVILSIWGLLSFFGNFLFGTNNFNALF